MPGQFEVEFRSESLQLDIFLNLLQTLASVSLALKPWLTDVLFFADDDVVFILNSVMQYKLSLTAHFLLDSAKHIAAISHDHAYLPGCH